MAGYSPRRRWGRRLAEAVSRRLHKLHRRLASLPKEDFPYHPTLNDVEGRISYLLNLEVYSGCTEKVEAGVRMVGSAIREDRVRSPRSSDEAWSVERWWVNLLRLGMFDELLRLIDRHELPLRPEVQAVLRYCAREYAASRQRGERYRAEHAGQELFTVGCIVWGERYIDNYLNYNLRSMLSDGNLPALRAQGSVLFSIVTDQAGRRQMEQSEPFAALRRLADVEFIILSDEVAAILSSGHVVRDFYMLYGMLDHCSIFLAQAAGAHLFMIPVDAIVADGSLANMANYRHRGFECCGGGNIVADQETFLPALDQRFGRAGAIGIGTEDLATLAVQHAHHYFRSQIVAVENQDFGRHPREIFWPVAGGVEIHSVFVHPLFTTISALERYRRRHYANVDYGMIPRMFADGSKFKILEDPREAYLNNFCSRERRYETNGRPFEIDDFLVAHDNSYPMQRSLITRAQRLPCRLEGWTAYRDVAADVHEIDARFAAERAKEMPRPSA